MSWPVFAKAAEIANYLKTVLSSNRAAKIDNLDITISSRASQVQTDSISGRIGLSSDAAGTTTLFARAKQIYDYLTTNLSSTRAGKIDNLDATMSSRAAASSLTALDNKVGAANPSVAGTDTIFTYLKRLEGMPTGILSALSWAGSFPFNAGGANITISSNTTWSDATRFRRVGVLTINAGVTLSIARSPFFIFADEIVFGSSASVIDISGRDGEVTGQSFTAAGGGNANARGGDGGGLLIIVADKISGAAGVIRANGGSGYHNGVSNSGSNTGGGGALPFGGIHPAGIFLVSTIGGGTYGDGSPATGSSANGPGGSGVGSGGSGYHGTASSAHGRAALALTPANLLELALAGCLGGGGGGSASNHGGGGGGGGICLFCRTFAATPSTQANGGAGQGSNSGNGGAGITRLVQV